jgi:hypothetical protein
MPLPGEWSVFAQLLKAKGAKARKKERLPNEGKPERVNSIETLANFFNSLKPKESNIAGQTPWQG